MNEEEFIKGIEVNVEELFFEVSAECNRLYKSGAIDVESYPNNAVLPKIIMHVALLNIADNYKPFKKEHLKEVKNLKNF